MATKVENKTNNTEFFNPFSEGNNIPTDIAVNIFSFLDPKSLQNCISSVCHQWNNELKNDEIWRSLFIRHLPQFNLQGNQDLQKTYIRERALQSNTVAGICSNYYLEGHIWSVITSLAIADNTLYTVAASDLFERYRVWDLSSEKNTQGFSAAVIRDLAFPVADGRIFSASCVGGIYFYDMHKKKWSEEPLVKHKQPVTCFAESERTADGQKIKVLFSGSADNTIGVWNLDSLEFIGRLEGHQDAVNCLTVSGKILFSGSADHTVMAWDVDSLKLIATMHGHTKPVRSLIVCDGKLFSASEDCSIIARDLNLFEVIATLNGHTDIVSSLAVLNSMLFSVSKDKTIKIWDVHSFQCTATLDDPDEGYRVNLIAACGKLYSATRTTTKGIRVWDFTASHRTILKEIAAMYKSGKVKEANMRLSRMRQAAEIDAEFDKICLKSSEPPSYYIKALIIEGYLKSYTM
jgi:WD40 repeat protein